ncbi:hypothetical protein [Jannaschia sp. CCS1]|uniref:hypothetical protein n=1 Tax=Jannaschia sp. (strain CCS1) TaxID=290400 RepID=UPI000053DE0E|nr:hypothetical protein [Jannaschia sp. CCS1]ABD55778.1 hypothetical protein Jann_2861 [Jannaschia sp. CCS1]
MTPLDLHSEKFARTGNIAGEGFRRLLGRPTLGLLQTVIREALQNSVDAAPRGNKVEVLLRFRTLEGETLASMRDFFFGMLPPKEADSTNEDDDKASLRDLLGEERLSILEIADFNTTGLAGPTRADVAMGEEDLDFVNFLRNVGAARDTQHGGGTYGYGKTSLYSLSRVSTIIADSQTTCDGSPVRRIMGCHLGDAFEAVTDEARRCFTGRHWWGRHDDEGGVEPLEGAEAVELSKLLGLPSRNESLPGTTIAIIAPHVDRGEDLRAELVETVLWNFWPRMCRFTSPERKIEVRVEFEGEQVEIPVPENYPPLDLYAQALRNVRGEGDGEVTTIRSGKPIADLGRLSIVRGLNAPRNLMALREESPMRQQAHAIALMRPVELVVRYLPGEAFADNRFEWAGVFICSKEDEVEKAFAVAEPPAHDDWIPDMLPKGRSKTFVNVALRELKLAAATYVQPMAALGTGEDRGPSVAKTAAKLGRLLSSTSGKGPGRATSPSGIGSRKKITISAPRFVGLEHHDGQRVARFEANLTNDGSRPDLILHGSPHLVLDGSLTSADDLPGDIVVDLVDLSLGDRIAGSEGIRIEEVQGTVSCRVTVPEDSAVGIRFSFEEESAK